MIEIGNPLEGLVKKFVKALTSFCERIGQAFKSIFSTMVEGVEKLVTTTPYPVKNSNGDPAYWSPDQVQADTAFDQAATYESIQGVAIVLLFFAAALAYSAKLWELVPFGNAQPSLERVFFALLLVVAWWPVMTGTLVLSDGLATYMLEAGNAIDDEGNAALSDMSDNAAQGEGLSKDSETQAEDDALSNVITAIAMIVIFAFNTGMILFFAFLWVLRYILVIMLGLAGPIFVALKAWEGSGISFMSNAGEKGLDLFWSLAFITIPAGLAGMIGGAMAELSGDVITGNGLAADIITSLFQAAVPLIVVAFPFYILREQHGMAGKFYDRVNDGVQTAGAAAATGATAAAGYAGSTRDGRLGRIGDAIDSTDSDNLNSVGRRLQNTRDMFRGATGRDAVDDDRFGRDTDAGGRSRYYNMFDSASAAISTEGEVMGQEFNIGSERNLSAEQIAEGADFDGTKYEGIDIDVEDVEEYDLDEGDRGLAALSNSRQREIRREIAEQKLEEQATSRERSRVDDLATDEKLAEKPNIDETTAREFKDKTNHAASVEMHLGDFMMNDGLKDLANAVEHSDSMNMSGSEFEQKLEEIQTYTDPDKRAKELKGLAKNLRSNLAEDMDITQELEEAYSNVTSGSRAQDNRQRLAEMLAKRNGEENPGIRDYENLDDALGEAVMHLDLSDAGPASGSSGGGSGGSSGRRSRASSSSADASSSSSATSDSSASSGSSDSTSDSDPGVPDPDDPYYNDDDDGRGVWGDDDEVEIDWGSDDEDSGT